MPDGSSPSFARDATLRADLSAFTRTQANGSASITLALEGIDCAACIGNIERALTTLPGVIAARLNFTTHRVSVDWRPQDLGADRIIATLEAIGHRAHPFLAGGAEGDEARRAAELLRALAVSAFAVANVMLLAVSVWAGNAADIDGPSRDLLNWISALIAIPACAYSGWTFYTSAANALRRGRLNMDVPISVGILLALGLSVYELSISAVHVWFDSATTLLMVLLAGRLIDHLMRKKTRAAAANLASLQADFAERFEQSGELVRVPAAALQPGDHILVRSGDRLAADAIILSGRSSIDEGPVTGETTPRVVGPDAQIHAGTINLEAALTACVTAAGTSTLMAEVDRLIEQASTAKSQRRALADRAADLYAPVVHLAALISCIGWLVAGAGFHQAIVVAVAVLIITCPCALALAVPAVQVVATGRLFSAGVLVHVGEAIERLGEVDTVVFDKTGTLTLAEPRVANASQIAPDLLALAGSLALSSHHPLARALILATGARHPVADAVEHAGRGVEAVVDGKRVRLGSPAFCGVDPSLAEADHLALAVAEGTRRALIQIRQQLRDDAPLVISELQARGLRVEILSGDRADAVLPVAAALGVTLWQSGIKPDAKIAYIETLQGQGRKVLMVGDGLNDAPALAAAHVSLSPATASDLTKAKADAVFTGDRLGPVLEALLAGRKARRLMGQNLALCVLYNVLAVPLAAFGLVTPFLAALAMSASSALVTLNALRGRA